MKNAQIRHLCAKLGVCVDSSNTDRFCPLLEASISIIIEKHSFRVLINKFNLFVQFQDKLSHF